MENQNKLFGLLGRNIAYSFSRGYFTEKFNHLGLEHCRYINFDLPNLESFKALWDNPSLVGMNVTIPYKQEVISHLDQLDETAAEIGAVNTIKKLQDGQLKGYNTDCIGFENALKPLLTKDHKKSLILGSGGASKAVIYVLQKLGISCQVVSRTPSEGKWTYDQLTPEQIEEHLLIVNCSPVGTHPKIEDKPKLPYENVGEHHLFFDLIYNPPETAFLKAAKAKGAKTASGLAMLEGQAEAAWSLWNAQPF